MFKSRVFLFALIAYGAIASAASFCPSVAQTVPPATVAVLPSDTELDSLLVARNWNALGAALSRPGQTETLARQFNWLHTRIDAGGGFLLSLLFARDMWALGAMMKIDDPSKDLRLTAAMMTLYTYELIVIDGAECADQTAPSKRLDQLFAARAETLAYLKKQPVDLKTRIVALAIALEQKTASLRKDDDLICRGGLEQMRAGIEAGKQHEAPDPARQYGKVVVIEPPADWVPKFVAPELYRPLQDAARSNMRERLLNLTE